MKLRSSVDEQMSSCICINWLYIAVSDIFNSSWTNALAKFACYVRIAMPAAWFSVCSSIASSSSQSRFCRRSTPTLSTLLGTNMATTLSSTFCNTVYLKINPRLYRPSAEMLSPCHATNTHQMLWKNASLTDRLWREPSSWRRFARPKTASSKWWKIHSRTML